MSRERIVHALLFTPISHSRWGLPAIFWGLPGVAKTAIIEAQAARWQLHCETLSPGERGEGAFGVTPVPGPDMKTITYPAPDWVEKVKGGGVIFLDEISCAEPALQKPMLGLIQARRIGSHELPGRCRVLGAANPVDLATGGWDLTPAVANRLGHLDWEAPSVDDWGDWLMSGANGDGIRGDAEKEEKRVLDNWATPWAKARGMVAGFVRRRSDLLHLMPKPGSPDLSRAWPSHRSWENAARSIASAEVHGLSVVDSEELIAAFVGRGAANEYITWQDKADLPDPALLLDGKDKYTFEPKRLDRALAVYSSCAALVAPKDAAKREERSSRLWKLLGEAKDAQDVTVPAARTLVRAGLTNVEGARSILAKLESVLSAADM